MYTNASDVTGPILLYNIFLCIKVRHPSFASLSPMRDWPKCQQCATVCQDMSVPWWLIFWQLIWRVVSVKGQGSRPLVKSCFPSTATICDFLPFWRPRYHITTSKVATYMDTVIMDKSPVMCKLWTWWYLCEHQSFPCSQAAIVSVMCIGPFTSSCSTDPWVSSFH